MNEVTLLYVNSLIWSSFNKILDLFTANDFNDLMRHGVCLRGVFGCHDPEDVEYPGGMELLENKKQGQVYIQGQAETC